MHKYFPYQSKAWYYKISVWVLNNTHLFWLLLNPWQWRTAIFMLLFDAICSSSDVTSRMSPYFRNIFSSPSVSPRCSFVFSNLQLYWRGQLTSDFYIENNPGLMFLCCLSCALDQSLAIFIAIIAKHPNSIHSFLDETIYQILVSFFVKCS